MVGLTTAVLLALFALGVREPGALIGLGALAALPVGLLVSWLMRRELMKITAAAQRLARGEAVGELGVVAPGPVGTLAHVFEEMAKKIQSQKAELVEERDANEDGLRRHEAVLRMAADGIITLREAGVVRTFNQAAEKIFGRAAAEVEKRPIREALPLPPGRENFFADLAERLRRSPPDAPPIVQELTGLRQGGDPFPMEVAASLARVKGREIVTVIVRDVTERKRAKELLEEQVRARTAELRAKNAELEQLNDKLEAANAAIQSAMDDQEAFMSNLSHDLRTPLTIVLGYSQRLFKQVRRKDQHEYAKQLDQIVKSGQDLTELINDSLHYYKYSSGQEKVPLDLQDVDLKAMLQERLESIEYLAGEKDNRFEARGLDDAGVLYTDRYLLWRILSNLLTNACKFTESGTIALEVGRSRDAGGWAVFQVRDTGLGIPEEKQRKIFERFQQETGRRPRFQSGIGLGLSICQLYSEALGGEVCLEQSSPAGSTFSLRLPLVCSPGAAAWEISRAGKPSAAGAPPGGAVLIIDDEKQVRELWETELRSQGYQIHSAPDGLEGLRKAKQLLPSAIILDMKMPGIDGWAVMGALKADRETAHIPIIIASVVDEQRRGYALGAEDYLVKPFSRESLTGLLRKHLPEPQKVHVLVVAHEEEARRELRRCLEEEWLIVSEAADGYSALNAVAAGRPDLIFLDLRVPGLDGVQLVDRIRGLPEGEKTAVVVLTGFAPDAEGRFRYHDEVDLVLSRSAFDCDALLERINRLVARYAGPRTLSGEVAADG
jgi:PAS domain S-box-containing protein